MKLTTFLLLICLIQVRAAVFGQQLNLVDKQVSVEKVLREIKKQTSYNVLVESSGFNISSKINANFKNASLQTVMTTILSGTNMTYVVDGKNIIIKKKEPSLLEQILDKLEALEVKGKILDEQEGPFPGAFIQVKGYNIRTISAADGTFTLKNVPENSMLVITCLGYKPVEVKAAKNIGNIRLQVESTNLTEVNVVRTGYQTISKERSAGSFAKADMEVIANRTSSMNILQNLDGQIPGLVVNNQQAKNQLLIRGLSTVGGYYGAATTGVTTAQPLYVVDGLAVPASTLNDNLPDIISSINPQDVQDITVLKDATAASIWGARAANGVIVITTKRGKFNSNLRVNYSGFVNFQGKPKLDYINYLTPRQFVEAGTEIFNSPGYTGTYPWATVSALHGGGITPLELILYNRSRGLITANQATSSLDSLAGLDNRSQINNLLYRNAVLANHTVSLSGGSNKYAFYTSTSYTNAVDNTPGNKNETYKINLNQNIEAAKFLHINLITELTYNTGASKRNYSADYSFTPYQLFQDANGRNLSIPWLTTQSNEVLQNMESRSRISLNYNPMDEFNYGNTQNDNLLARLNGSFKLDIFKGLSFNGTYGYIRGKNKIRDLETQQSFTVRKEVVQFTVADNPTVTPKYYLPTAGGRLTNINGEQHKWDVRNQLTYDNTWGKHAVTALFGQEAQEQFSSALSSRARGFDDLLLTQRPVDYATLASPILNTIWPTISTLASSMTNDSFGNNENTSRYTSYYANLAYTFDRRYTINGSWRNDQSNLFGKDKSAQNKPIWSIGGSWNIGNEAFMKPVTWVQRLALRLTYGITGNSPATGVAASQDITAPVGSAFFPGSIGLLITTPSNPKLSWERTATTNLGLDVSVLNDRLSASVDFYQKKTTDVLGTVYLSSLSGYTSVTGNQGNITNKGIEATLHSVNIAARHFKWTTNWVFAYNKNTVDTYNRVTTILTSQLVQLGLREKYPAYAMFSYKYGGLDNTGAPQVVLADGTVTSDRNITKEADLVYSGTEQPVWNGGLTNTFQYKNFRLTTNIVYNMGHVMRRPRYLLFGGQLDRNLSADFLNRWKTPGDEQYTNIPGYSAINRPINTDYFTYGDVNVISASFVKLRDMTLFYDLPKSLVRRIKAQGITLRAQISNVMLWTKNRYGIDPEFQLTSPPTNQNTISFGANISL